MAQIVRIDRHGAETDLLTVIISFRVLVTSDSSGLIETIRNTISIHSIKKEAYTRGWNTKGTVFTLYDYFEKVRAKGKGTSCVFTRRVLDMGTSEFTGVHKGAGRVYEEFGGIFDRDLYPANQGPT